jgi:HSP20 family protein
MAILRWRDTADPFSHLSSLRGAVDQIYGDYMGRSGVERSYGGVFSPLNITESENNLYVRAELPGVDAQEIHISATTDSITLTGERKVPKVSEEIGYHQRERDFGTFKRIINLPTKINTDKISASYKNGILIVVLPKAEEMQPKQIKITTSSMEKLGEISMAADEIKKTGKRVAAERG